MAKKDKSNKIVPIPQLPKDLKIKFSFEYYDTLSTKYCMSNMTQEQVLLTLSRLKDISTKTFKELTTSGRYVYHFGDVIWEKTIEKNGFPYKEANEMAAFHFSLLNVNGQKARVYGAYSEGVFFIVWFDMEHKIWPTPLKHT